VVAAGRRLQQQFRIPAVHWQSSVVLGYPGGRFLSRSGPPGLTNVVDFGRSKPTSCRSRPRLRPAQRRDVLIVSVKRPSRATASSAPWGPRAGVLMDFVIPPTPAATIKRGEHAPGQLGLRERGPSGIAGYRIEYRRADNPLWYNAEDQASRSPIPGPRPRPRRRRLHAAAVSADELVTGVSYQATRPPAGRCTSACAPFRERALAGSPTDPLKVRGEAAHGGISEISCYPNPSTPAKSRDTSCTPSARTPM